MSSKIKHIINYKNKARKILYDRNHKKEALLALNNIKEDTNYSLSKKEMKLIKEYANEVLGSTTYIYWLYVYTAYNQKFVEGWIPDNYFGYIVAPKVNKNIGEISTIKTLSKKIINTNLLPDKFYLIDNVFYDLNFKVVDSQVIIDYLSTDVPELYFKKDRSNKGTGVIRVTKDNFNLQEIFKFGDCVIQNPISQDNWFDEIIKGSVATLRITTVKGKDKKMKNRAAYLRVGRSDSQLVQSANSISIPIIDENGTLGENAATPNWIRCRKHPDSGFEFAGRKIPHFAKAVSVCEKVHENLPHFTIIGWDVAITKKGEVKIIEWNTKHPGIKFTEAFIGPSFTNLGWEDLWRN